MTSKSPVKLKKKAPKAAAMSARKRNNVCFIIDRSGSMNVIRQKVVDVFNAQAELHREMSASSDQDTFVSLLTFNDNVDAPVFFDAPVDELGELDIRDYNPTGGTALFDCVGEAMTKLDSLPDGKNKNASFLLVIITDGEENSSRRWSAFQLGEYMKKVNLTDRWTVTFLVPNTAAINYLSSKLYVPEGNFQVWEQTNKGVEKANLDINVGTRSYYSARSAGHGAIKSFFQPDVTKVKSADLKRELNDVTKRYKVWDVNKTTVIKDFVEEQGEHFIPGRAFYQLVKPEEVQAFKGFAIQNGKAIYEGNDAARRLLGLPAGGTIKLHPAQASALTIFVQSTSMNRKLHAGTKLLYQSN